MKKLLLFVLSLGLVLLGFTGCKKHGDDTNKKSCVVNKAIYNDKNSAGDFYQYATYEYDNQKRLIKIRSYWNDVPEGYSTITYGGSEIIEKSFDSNGSEFPWYPPSVYTVSNGIVTRSVQTYIEQMAPGFFKTQVTTTAYEHNSEGYLTKKTMVIEATSNDTIYFVPTTVTIVITYAYEDGNLLNKVEDFPSGNRLTTTYEYFKDIPNTLHILDNADFILPDIPVILATKPNKNALKKATQTSGSGFTTFRSFTYLLDADGLITKRTTFDSQISGHSEIFEYTCN